MPTALPDLSPLASDELLSLPTQHRYSCSLADGSPVQLTQAQEPQQRSRHRRLGWANVAFGMMAGRGVRKPGTLEFRLLESARGTWMATIGEPIGFLLLGDCLEGTDDDGEMAPAWMMADARATSSASVLWRCYRHPVAKGSSLWRKTLALLRSLFEAFPGREIALKVDIDTLVLPRALMQYLRFLRESRGSVAPLYFGNGGRVVYRGLYCWGARCFFRTEGWAALLRRQNWTDGELQSLRNQPVSYAAGGLYGFNRAALARVAAPGAQCLPEAAAAVTAYRDAGHRIAHMAEDELVGMCMLAARVRLVSCECFYQYGPCDCHNVSGTCADGTHETRICRLPLSIHHVKRAAWYLPWWKALTEREVTHLADVGARAPGRVAHSVL
jgi:hypothetical protein